MQLVPPIRRSERVHCSLCGHALFTVSDTRFGARPRAVLCPPCTVAAFQEDVLRS